MALQKSFIHGNMISAEIAGPGPGPFTQIPGRPFSEFLGVSQGWGKSYQGRAGASTWFHASIPTPVIQSGSRIGLDNIFILFDARASTMTAINIWDGIGRISIFDNLHTTGDNSRNPVPGINMFSPRGDNNSRHIINFGLNISMHIQFNNETVITFYSAGADFLT